ncbi:MAG TPA: hypothetical protein DD670_17465 [Planctomycetaceae bacterium]|nr:hypothetical protein [Planctomycetaceae bacterium]
MPDFVDTLSPAEQAFLEKHLLGGDPSDGSGGDLSEANFWQIASRIRRKLHRFFHTEEKDATPKPCDGENQSDGDGRQAEAPAEEDSGTSNHAAVRRRTLGRTAACKGRFGPVLGRAWKLELLAPPLLFGQLERCRPLDDILGAVLPRSKARQRSYVCRMPQLLTTSLFGATIRSVAGMVRHKTSGFFWTRE